MMNDEEISDVLSTSHGQPILPSRVQINKFVQVVKLILNNPVVGSVTPPQLRIPCLLLLEPNRSVALQTTRRQTLPVLLCLNNLHSFIILDLIVNSAMNQKTLQNIYKTFETEEFYRRYLVDLGCREDRRKIDEHRTIRATSKNNSVVLSCGQTIIITHIEAAVEQVTFSPVSNSYGEPLLKIKVSNANNTQKVRENKADKAVQHYIQQKIDWSYLEDQLAGSDLITGKQYAYKGNIIIRILGDDGGAEEYSLLAIQLLLLTCKFKKFLINKEKIEFKEDFSLAVKSIVYPLKYCEILGKVLVDPSLTESHNADLVVTVLKELKSLETPPTVIQGVKKLKGDSTETHLINIMKRWEIDFAKIKAKFSTKVQELISNNECILN